MLPLVITSAGENLISSVVGSGEGIVFTRICTSAQSLSESQLKEIASLEIMQSADVSGRSCSGNLCEIFSVLDNSGLMDGYFIRALGVYAQSSSGEILFGVCIEDSDAFYMPAGSDNSRTEVTLRVALSMLNSSDISVAVSSDAYASAVLLSAEINKINSRIDALDFNESILRKIDEHNLDDGAHPALLGQNAEIITLQNKVAALEIAAGTEIASNPFVVSFSNLDGVEVNGVWENSAARIAF